MRAIGVRDHFRFFFFFLGGHNIFCPNFSSLPEKSNMFGQCIFASHVLGGGGVRRAALFGVIEYGTPQRGRVWTVDPPPTVGTFCKFGY